MAVWSEARKLYQTFIYVRKHLFKFEKFLFIHHGNIFLFNYPKKLGEAKLMGKLPQM